MQIRQDIEVNELILKIKEEFDDLPPGKIDPKSILRKVIDWNSINSLVMITMIECEFDVLLTVDDFKPGLTVEGLFKIINSRRAS